MIIFKFSYSFNECKHGIIIEEWWKYVTPSRVFHCTHTHMYMNQGRQCYFPQSTQFIPFLKKNNIANKQNLLEFLFFFSSHSFHRRWIQSVVVFEHIWNCLDVDDRLFVSWLVWGHRHNPNFGIIPAEFKTLLHFFSGMCIIVTLYLTISCFFALRFVRSFVRWIFFSWLEYWYIYIRLTSYESMYVWVIISTKIFYTNPVYSSVDFTPQNHTHTHTVHM